jgi:adenylate cyclase
MPFFSDIAQVAGVWASIMGGLSNHPEAELRSAEQSLARLENERFRAYRTVVLAKFAECYRALGMPEQARQKVEEGLKVASDKNDRFFEPELHRIRASLVSQAQAEQYLEKAWLLAESQGSVWLSLRASTDLVNLLQDQARCGPARARLRMSLSAVEGGEGLPDLERARRALEGASA